MSVMNLTENDSEFLTYLRGLSIFVIVFGHVGGFWVFKPYSEFLHVFVSIFFFLSGAVSYFSYLKSSSIILYYKKRVLGLLIPFYLICVLSFVVFLIENRQFPIIDIVNILKWIQIRPSNDIMPFPIGQVWFLNTLFFITLISPLYFLLKNKREQVLIWLIIVIIVLSGVQLFYDIDHYFFLLKNNLYKPIIHSAFYIFGILCFSSNKYNNIGVLAPIIIVGIISSIFFVMILKIDIDYAYHTYAPDAYYVLGSFSAIAFIVLIKNYIVHIAKTIIPIKIILLFFHKHTFSIFLLHTFSIYLSETLFNMVNPTEKTITYGIIKLITVLIITCLLAIPYSAISNYVIAAILQKPAQQNF